MLSLWGALRIRKIETLLESESFLTQEEIARSLADLGISFQKAPPLLYGQSDLLKLPLEKILVEESLKTGVLCSETAFVAVREEKGIPVSQTFLIPNALPRGWNADPGVVFPSARFAGFNPLQIDETVTRAFEADSDTMSAVFDSPKYCRMSSSLKHQMPSASSSSGPEKIEIFRGPLPPYEEKGTVLFSCTGGEGVLKDAAMLVGLRAETVKKSFSAAAGKGKVRVLVNGKVVVSVPLQKLLAMRKTRPLNILLKKGDLLSIDIMDSLADEKCPVKMTLFFS